MTLEAVFADSSAQADDYAWHDLLTELDFRPEDLWEFDCEALSEGNAGPSAQHPSSSSPNAPQSEEPPSPVGGYKDGSGPSQLVWELITPTQDNRTDDDRAHDHSARPEASHISDDGAHDHSARPEASRIPDDVAHADGAAGLSGRVVLTGLENLNPNDTTVALKGLAGLRSWVDAMEVRIVSRLADLSQDYVSPRFPGGSRGEEMARSVAASEIALTLNIPERTASRLVDESTHLTVKHRATLEALESGSISRRHAVLIADESLGMPAGAVAGFERALLDEATGLTVAKLARRARRLREVHHPETLPIRRAKAVAERHVELRPDDDGMAWLHAYLTAEQACGIYQRLTATAQKLQTPDEPRSLTQLRADIFADLLTYRCAPGKPQMLPDGGFAGSANADEAPDASGSREEPAWQGVTAHVNVTVPVLALLDVLNSNDYRSTGNAPGTSGAATSGKDNGPGCAPDTAESDARGHNLFPELEGYGPIDPETAAKLTAHAPSFTRILTHPVTGSVLDVGRETYRPPKHLQDWVRARDRTCRHPGCNRSAIGCEIDHTVPWARGGTTSHQNLACFCPKHHMYKSEGIFGYRQPSPGTIVARTRAGTVHTSTPEPPF